MHRIALSTMRIEARFAILVFLEFLGDIVCGAQIGPVYRAVCGQPLREGRQRSFRNGRDYRGKVIIMITATI
ncbi:hypothetical protein CEXT_660131 [Caerostris extrusa]|uniref:Secreted protein n=1 Tax=Caerostris extrusa TaxID=172846 RepID=A0AAV4N5D4_CAEEX|nr:hypothetical protein CEXT_660131 [Caerostris extrusa]